MQALERSLADVEEELVSKRSEVSSEPCSWGEDMGVGPCVCGGDGGCGCGCGCVCVEGMVDMGVGVGVCVCVCVCGRDGGCV